MNYMDEVAEILGIELYDEFKVKGFDDKFMLTPNGMFYYDQEDKKWEASLMIYDILNGTREIVKPILNKKEKEYLAYVIKPFRGKIKDIHKYECGDFQDGEGECERIAGTTSKGRFEFPAFKKGSMYKGMFPNMEYTLEELGL